METEELQKQLKAHSIVYHILAYPSCLHQQTVLKINRQHDQFN